MIKLMSISLDIMQIIIDRARELISEKPVAKNQAIIDQSAVNSTAVDYMPYETADLEIPIIRSDVLVYGPGELGNGTTIGREGARVFYSPEAISDPDFIESCEKAVYSVRTHEKNTSEANLHADGFTRKAWYDPKTQTTYGKGVLIGSDNIKFVKDNKLVDGFGTSAFIKFIDMKRQSGISSTGIPYDTVATKLSCGHVAILDKIRDPKNVIIAINALQDNKQYNATNELQSTNTEKEIKKNSGGYMADEKELKSVVKDAMNEAAEEKEKNDKYSAMENSLKAANEKLAAYENKSAKNELSDKKDEEKKVESENAKEDEEKKVGSENAKNALASENLIAAASEVLGVRFDKAPTLIELGKDFGITGANKLEIATALNAKIKELKNMPTAMNSEKDGSYEDLLRKF